MRLWEGMREEHCLRESKKEMSERRRGQSHDEHTRRMGAARDGAVVSREKRLISRPEWVPCRTDGSGTTILHVQTQICQ